MIDVRKEFCRSFSWRNASLSILTLHTPLRKPPSSPQAARWAELVAMLFLTAPIGVLFAVAPLAFGLAFGGAWIGLER